MRRVIIALAATIAGLMASATPINAAPSATLTSPMADGGLVQKVQVYPRHYYRQHPYGAPPVVHAVPPVVHVVPPVVHVAARCPRRAARCPRRAAATSDKLWPISLLEWSKLRRRPLQQALPRSEAVAGTPEPWKRAALLSFASFIMKLLARS